jgi:hypothetical protein
MKRPRHVSKKVYSKAVSGGYEIKPTKDGSSYSLYLTIARSAFHSEEELTEFCDNYISGIESNFSGATPTVYPRLCQSEPGNRDSIRLELFFKTDKSNKLEKENKLETILTDLSKDLGEKSDSALNEYIEVLRRTLRSDNALDEYENEASQYTLDEKSESPLPEGVIPEDFDWEGIRWSEEWRRFQGQIDREIDEFEQRRDYDQEQYFDRIYKGFRLLKGVHEQKLSAVYNNRKKRFKDLCKQEDNVRSQMLELTAGHGEYKHITPGKHIKPKN